MTFPPFFIIGNRRSGTTLLRLMLTSHPNLVVPPEGGFIYSLGWKYKNKNFSKVVVLNNFLDDLFRNRNIVDWEFSRDELFEKFLSNQIITFTDAIETVYQLYSLKKYNSFKKWGDKSTGYISHLDEIKRYFPLCKFIHIVRDPRAVVSSYKNVTHLNRPVDKIAYEWKWNINFIKKYFNGISPNDYLEIRYEDLVQDSEKELNKICLFLGVNFSLEMKNYWKINRERKLEPDRHMNWKKLTKEKPDITRIYSWKEDLNESDIKVVNKICNTEMIDYKYIKSDRKNNEKIDLKYTFFYYTSYLKKHLRKVKYKIL